MPVFKLLRFFAGAAEHADLDAEALRRSGVAAPRHQSYHRRVVRISIVTGVLVGAAAAVVFFGGMFRDGPPEQFRDLILIYLSPLLGGAAGVLLGASAACACAPREFLAGPVGERWVRLSGVGSPEGARVVFAVVTVVIALVILFPVVAPMLEARGYLPQPRPHKQ